ncbi:MAG: hypothetical protein MJE68_04065, partial [Proteobacteria bacterium]|nr:hypothetical protein [Pseudomonadota bacterium]
CGDLNFPLPYSPELHFSEFNSVVADMKNSVAVGFKKSFYFLKDHATEHAKTGFLTSSPVLQ